MNSLLINAGIPQLRCVVVADGPFVYEEKLPCASQADNYQKTREQVEKLFLQVSALATPDEPESL